mmetsp:Transcript_28710/g.51530  ORF Transcript_28710/g.51530 Transcript_28710/m.51530 type:complete len:214 (-) Transcript_28710:397-1038(-)
MAFVLVLPRFAGGGLLRGWLGRLAVLLAAGLALLVLLFLHPRIPRLERLDPVLLLVEDGGHVGQGLVGHQLVVGQAQAPEGLVARDDVHVLQDVDDVGVPGVGQALSRLRRPFLGALGVFALFLVVLGRLARGCIVMGVLCLHQLLIRRILLRLLWHSLCVERANLPPDLGQLLLVHQQRHKGLCERLCSLVRYLVVPEVEGGEPPVDPQHLR